MIVTSSPKIRPVYTLAHSWQRKDIEIEADGHSISMSGFSVSEERLIDLSADIGVVCYATYKDDLLIVFDFSASHLCPQQLQRIKHICKCL